MHKFARHNHSGSLLNGSWHTLSCPAVSQIWNFTVLLSTVSDLDIKEALRKKPILSLTSDQNTIYIALQLKFNIVIMVSFTQGGGKMRLYELLGEQVCICVQSMGQTRGGGPGACSPGEILFFWPFSSRNLVKSGDCFYMHNSHIYCAIKAFINAWIDLHVK